MKLHYKGTYNLNPDSLPHSEHKPNAVAFKEPRNMKTFSLLMNGLSLFIILLLAVFAFFRCRNYFEPLQFALGCIVPILLLFPHEYLHALCFRDDVFLYTNFKQGMLFVAGTESMSKARFVMMSLLPNIVFGFIPYVLGMLFPQFIFLAVCGIFSIGMGAGDYYNVFNALTQMPKGAQTYLYGFNSYWYMP